MLGACSSDLPKPPLLTARLGPDRTVFVGETVVLDASQSADSAGRALVFEWSMLSWPATSSGSFTSQTDARATFVADAIGTYVVSVRVTAGADSARAQIQISATARDTVAPETRITAAPPTTSASAEVTFAFSADDPAATFRCQLDGGTAQPCTSPQRYGALSEGQHTFSVAALDAAGNADPTPATFSFRIDTTPPAVQLLNPPTGLTAVAAALLAFEANEPGCTFRCVLDGVESDCTSPLTLSGLAEGGHAASVIATDPAGNRSSPAVAEWSVDTRAPTTSLVSSPPSVTRFAAATFTFTADEADSVFRCALDGAMPQPCESPWAVQGLADGTHSVAITALDVAGNVGAPATFTWSVDTAPPVTSWLSRPSNPTRARDATFTFVGSEPGVTFQCSLDDAPLTPCTAPHAVTGLGDGLHWFAVTATDAAGNVAARPATYLWVVDTTSPETLLTSSPPSLTNQRSATFTFVGTKPGGTFQCALDGAPAAPCASPKVYDALQDGTHTVGVAAVDALGNLDSTPAIATWTVDTTPPDTTLTGQPPATSASTSASFTFVASEAASFRCAVDAAAPIACASPFAVNGLTEGEHQLSVTAIDAAGNLDATPATYRWRVALPGTALDTLLTGGPANPTTATQATFWFSATVPNATFRCQLDTQPEQPCTSPRTYSDLGLGIHDFRVTAVDAAGNADPTPAPFRWTISAPPLDTTLTGAPGSVSNSNSAAFFFSSQTANATFQCALDGQPATPCTSPKSYSGLAEGGHTFFVAATVGTAIDVTPASWTWSIDTQPPSTTIDAAPGSPNSSRTPTFRFSSTEAGGTFLCRLDNAPLAPCTSPMTTASLADGPHRFSVVAVDAAGNRDPAPPGMSWVVDATPPETTLTPSVGPLAYSGTASFDLTSNEPGTFRCSLDGAAASACAATTKYTALAEGLHTLSVQAIDAAGNVDPTPATFTWRVHLPWTLVNTLPGTSSGGWLWASALGGKLYAASASNASTPPFSKTYDPTTDTFGEFAYDGNVFCACGYVSPLAAAAGKFFLFANVTRSYDPASNTWSSVSIPHVDGEWGVANLGEQLYFLGGRSDSTTLRRFDPVTSTWASVGTYPSNVYTPSLAAFGGKLYVFGGSQSGINVKMNVFDPATGDFTPLDDAPFTFQSNYTAPKAVALGANIYVLGYRPFINANGDEDSEYGYYVYDPATDTWDPLPIPMPEVGQGPVHGSQLAPVVIGGELYLIGDAVYGNDVALSVWKFVPLQQ